jgi:hypothetical protein
MNRFGYLPETVYPSRNFSEEMYADPSYGMNAFGYQNGYNSEDDLAHHFGRMDIGNHYNQFGNHYNQFGIEDSEDSDSDSDSDEENEFGQSGFGNNSDDDSEDSDEDEENAFGKKLRRVQLNAKRAMQLAHREDISLKEAWAIIKGEKKGKSRRSTRKRTTKRTAKKSRSRGRSEAAKAMKLKHQKGYSLKKAWQEVKKQRR